METKSSESVSLISDHFKKRRKLSNQRSRPIKCKVDVNSSANEQCDKSSSTELKVGKKRKRTTKKTPVDDNLLGDENAEMLTIHHDISKFIWNSLDRLVNVDGDEIAKLGESNLEGAAASEIENGILPTQDSSLTNVQSLETDLDESLLKNVSSEEEKNSLAVDAQLNESRISLTGEISFSNIHCSSSYDLDESIIKDVSSEKREVDSTTGISGFEEKDEEEEEDKENTATNYHSLSSSQNSMIEDCIAQNKINSVGEEYMSLTPENWAALNPVETASDPTTPNPDFKPNKKEEEASTPEEPIWECEELEQSFSDIVDDLEKCIEEQESNNKSCSKKTNSTRLPKRLSATPKKTNPESNNNIIDASSPIGKEKFSPHIMKSPKKYFGSSSNRKIIKENKNSSPSSSFKAKSKGLFATSKGLNKINCQKRISDFFSQTIDKSNSGSELKEAFGQGNTSGSASETSENINLEDKKNSHFSSYYLRIFEDCLKHIHEVILPVERYLFDENEWELLNSVYTLNDTAKCLYFRLLHRKHSWIRRTKINYEDLNPSMDEDLHKLEALGLLSSDCTKEDVDILLQLLSMHDLKRLCRLFRVEDKGNKLSLILNLTKMTNNQTTLDGKRDSHWLIKKELKSFLQCVQLTPEPRQTFLKCLRIYSFSYSREVEEKMVQDIVNNNFRVNNYPKFVVKHAVVFHSKENFDEYEKSLKLLSEVMTDNKPNHERLSELINRARTEFKQCLSSEGNRLIWERTPDYLMKFSAANVYAGIVLNNINVLKKNKTNKRQMDEAVEFLERLIEEKQFLTKKRGHVYDALIRIYRQKKDFHKAFSTFMKARDDDSIPQVIQFTLLAQMKPMLRQKAVSVYIKAKLQDVCNLPWFSCTAIKTITVLAKSTPSDRPNRKKVYVTKSGDCTYYQSVEELVVNHYKKTGWNGFHDEGSLLKNIIFACFWDIIFESPTLENDEMSVFVSKYQMRPLDWGSRTFYLRRESAIKERLIAIENCDWKAVYNRVYECFKNHAGELFNKSIWNWIKYDNLRNIEGFLMCLSTKFIASVAEWLLKDFASYSSGFPDCTFWNRKNRQCLFVEVKSPSDTLAKHQEFWLKQIEEFGGNSVICHVKEIGSSSSKLKSEDET